ncbi:hypothetical protein ACFQUZ_08085, partial [Plantactinospora sp. GCM10030261]
MPDPGYHRAPSLFARHRPGRPGPYAGRGDAYAGRRVTGVHRADGLAGPARRYLLTVALLAGTASLPIVAVISTGSATVQDRGGSGSPDGLPPLFDPPSEGPVVVVPLPPASPIEDPSLNGVGDRTVGTEDRREPPRGPRGIGRSGHGKGGPDTPGGRPPGVPSPPGRPIPSPPGSEPGTPSPTGTPSPSPSPPSTGTPSPTNPQSPDSTATP